MLALKGEIVFMTLHMIVHCVLALLGDATLTTDKVAGSILLVCVRHVLSVRMGLVFLPVQFFLSQGLSMALYDL